MPLYLCSAKSGLIAEDVKQDIARDLTRIHCDVTDAPPTFVHVFFRELDEGAKEDCFLFGSIRAGRTEEQRQQIHREMREAVSEKAGIEFAKIDMISRDVPASWIMEGGDILPEPGEEAEWMERHHAKTA